MVITIPIVVTYATASFCCGAVVHQSPTEDEQEQIELNEVDENLSNDTISYITRTDAEKKRKSGSAFYDRVLSRFDGNDTGPQLRRTGSPPPPQSLQERMLSDELADMTSKKAISSFYVPNPKKVAFVDDERCTQGKMHIDESVSSLDCGDIDTTQVEVKFKERKLPSSFIGSSHAVSGFEDGIFTRGKLREIIPDAEPSVVKFNLDSSIIAVGFKKGKGVALYETEQFNVMCTLEFEDTVASIDWTFSPPDSTCADILVFGGHDGKISMFSVIASELMIPLKKPTLLLELRVESKVNCVVFGGGPHLLAIGQSNGIINLLSPYAATFPTDSESIDSEVMTITFTKQADLMAVGSHRGSVIVFKVDRDIARNVSNLGEKIKEIKMNGIVRSLSFSQDSKQLASGGYGRHLNVIDTSVWQVVRKTKHEGTIDSLTYDPTNKFLAVGSRDKVLTIIDVATLHPIKRLQCKGWVMSISWGSNQHKDHLVMREHIVPSTNARQLITMLSFKPVRVVKSDIPTDEGENSSLSFSFDSEFLVRANGCFLLVSHPKNDFFFFFCAQQIGTIACVRFCLAEGMRNLIAAVGQAGCLIIYKLRISKGQFFLETIHNQRIEDDLRVVEWSSDGSVIAVGGEGRKIHLFSTPAKHSQNNEEGEYKLLCSSIEMDGKIWTIDFVPKQTLINFGTDMTGLSFAVGTGYCATLFDISTFKPTIQIMRPRLVRSLRYHPTLPILVIGDGGNSVAVIDLITEQIIREFLVGGRVYGLDFSAQGGFLAVASDDNTVTMHEAASFKVIQEIETQGYAKSVAFSRNGSYLAIDSAGGGSVLQLGSLFGINFFPLKMGISNLPPGLLNEAIYRCDDGPSLIQRYMQDGSKESMQHAGDILKQHPEAIYTFDRKTGKNCLDMAFALGKPGLMKLMMTILVNGSLESENDGTRSVLTTSLPESAFSILCEMILHQPADYAIEILNQITFVKVPFATPSMRSELEPLVCGSMSVLDPWEQSAMSSYSKKKKGHATIRVPAVLPLPGLGSFEFLSALTTESTAKAFDNEAMGVVLRVMWDTYIRRYFLLDAALFLLFVSLWMFYVDITSPTTSQRLESKNELTILVLSIVILALNTLYTFKELVQAEWGRNSSYFRSLWNYFDLSSIMLVYASVITTIVLGSSGKNSVELDVVATLTLTCRVLSYLRGSNTTGWLISVLVRSFYDVRGFVAILFVIIVGFTAAFRILFADVNGSCNLALDDEGHIVEDCMRNPYGTPFHSLLSTFELTIVGQYDTAIFDESQHKNLSIIVFCLAVTVVLVVALNALIAVLGDSYSRVQANSIANLRKERAELIVEYLVMLPRKKRKKIEAKTRYFHALLESDADGDLLINHDDWKGGLNALRHDLNEISTHHTNVIQRSIEKMDNELSNLRSEVSMSLQKVSREMNELKKMHRKTEKAAMKGEDMLTVMNNTVRRIGKGIAKPQRQLQRWNSAVVNHFVPESHPGLLGLGLGLEDDDSEHRSIVARPI